MRDVVVVGGGPVGLFLGTLLAARGLDVVVWEKRTRPAVLSRAIGVHPPALEAFARVGIADDVTAAAVLIRRGIAKSDGRTLGAVSFAGVSEAFPFVASLPQFRTEAVIAARLRTLAPAALQRGVELVGIDDLDPGRVRLRGRSNGSDRFEMARFVVAADGARSAVRRLLAVPARLRVYDDPFVMGDFRDDTGAGDDAVVHLEGEGVVESFPLPGGLRRFVVHTGEPLPRPTPEMLAALIGTRIGAEVDASTNSMLSAFSARRRLAQRMVRGRVVLIGDAAHEISPIGGQGMNLGWLDAAELDPILAGALGDETSGSGILDAFETRRMGVARRAARQAERNMAMGRPLGELRRTARNVGFGLLLATPARDLLARAYSMTRA